MLPTSLDVPRSCLSAALFNQFLLRDIPTTADRHRREGDFEALLAGAVDPSSRRKSRCLDTPRSRMEDAERQLTATGYGLPRSRLAEPHYCQRMGTLPLIFLVAGVILLVSGFVYIFVTRRRIGPPMSKRDQTVGIVIVGAGGGLITSSLGSLFYN